MARRDNAHLDDLRVSLEAAVDYLHKAIADADEVKASLEIVCGDIDEALKHAQEEGKLKVPKEFSDVYSSYTARQNLDEKDVPDPSLSRSRFLRAIDSAPMLWPSSKDPVQFGDPPSEFSRLSHGNHELVFLPRESQSRILLKQIAHLRKLLNSELTPSPDMLAHCKNTIREPDSLHLMFALKQTADKLRELEAFVQRQASMWMPQPQPESHILLKSTLSQAAQDSINLLERASAQNASGKNSSEGPPAPATFPFPPTPAPRPIPPPPPLPLVDPLTAPPPVLQPLPPPPMTVRPSVPPSSAASTTAARTTAAAAAPPSARALRAEERRLAKEASEQRARQTLLETERELGKRLIPSVAMGLRLAFGEVDDCVGLSSGGDGAGGGGRVGGDKKDGQGVAGRRHEGEEEEGGGGRPPVVNSSTSSSTTGGKKVSSGGGGAAKEVEVGVLMSLRAVHSILAGDGSRMCRVFSREPPNGEMAEEQDTAER